MKLALHRSLTFWSGVLTMAFICWAWRDSAFYQSQIQRRYWMAVHSFSGITLARTSYPTREKSRVPLDTSIRFEVTPPPFYFRSEVRPGKIFTPRITSSEPKPPTYRQSKEVYAKNILPPDCWILFIPYWLILLAVALPWTGMLVWRGRRRKVGFDSVNPAMKKHTRLDSNQ